MAHNMFYTSLLAVGKNMLLTVGNYFECFDNFKVLLNHEQ